MTKSNINWEEIFNLYNTIKWMYALCEETDEDLNTNLQPLNEFRAALDHLMRIVAIENLEDYADKDVQKEVDKLRSHFRRAFFDICDMLSINYRTKIVDVLEEYEVDEIRSAIPTYYPTIRPRLEEITEIIASLRTEKRFGKSEEETPIDEYSMIIKELQGYYKQIVQAIPAMNDIRTKNIKKRRNDIAVQWIIPISGILIGAIIAVVGWMI